MSTPSLHPFKNKLLALMVFRVAAALVFLGTTVWFQIKGASFSGPFFYPLYVIVVSIGVITIVYAYLLNIIKRLRFFAYLQITVDVLLISGIVYITGGIVSYLSILYPLLVIGSSTIVGRRGGYYTAGISSIAYGILIDLDFYRLLPTRYRIIWPAESAWEDVLTTIATNMLAFFIVAYLTGHLAEKTMRMEKALEEKDIDFKKLENLNRLIADNIPLGVMTLDEIGRITSFNKGATGITGHTLRGVYYKNYKDIFPGVDLSGSPEGYRFEKKFSFHTLKNVFLGFTVSGGRGGDMSHIVIFQDLTQIKAMEDELRRDEKLKALGELSASIAHEIRNPLASISGSIQVLNEDLKLSGDKRHLMEIVLRESNRLNALINDFLLFAKPAKEKQESVDISEVIRETVKVFTNSPQAVGIEISHRLGTNLLVEGNRRQITQVFWNLFLNAASAMPNGGKLTVSSERSKDAVWIEVMDTGTGILPENIANIFDPFFSTRERGTGMGLSLVHRIVENHGGTISVASGAGEGTIFKIMLPLRIKEAV